MELIQPGTYIDFMKYRTPVVTISIIFTLVCVASLIFPGPKLGIDFSGGAEVQVSFPATVTAATVRNELEALGHNRPDVVSVEAEEFLVRIEPISAEDDVEAKRAEYQSALERALGTEVDRIQIAPSRDRITVKLSDAKEPAAIQTALEGAGAQVLDVIRLSQFIIRIEGISAEDVAVKNREYKSALERGLVAHVQRIDTSRGLDKITLKLSDAEDPADIQAALEAVNVRVREVATFGRVQDHRYEVFLYGIAHEMLTELRNSMGENGPQEELRVEWVGDRAGEQLRSAAIQSLLYAIAFIMIYVALRFDIRFAPGAVVAMLHDVIIAGGVYVLVQREVNLTTVAALLTILGFSINDTIVVYDRIRENMGRYRDRGLAEVINISTSQMLSRTLVTSGTALLSIAAFFVFGTPVIQDICYCLFVGFLVGVYSSIYIAAPFTEWMDRRFFSRLSTAK